MMSHAQKILLGFCLVTYFLAVADAHAYMLEPTGRSSLFRNKMVQKQLGLADWDAHCEYNNNNNLSAPWNCRDNGVNCGNRGDGVGIGQDLQYSNCGPCGDKLSDPRPRDNEHNGKYDKNIIVANYTQGQMIHTTVIVTNPHDGYVQWHLCRISNLTVDQNGTWTDEVESCFDNYLLLRTDGTDRLYVNTSFRPNDMDWDSDNIEHNPEGPVYLDLPAVNDFIYYRYIPDYGYVIYTNYYRYILKMTYRSGRSLNGKLYKRQESFISCADVMIQPNSTALSYIPFTSSS